MIAYRLFGHKCTCLTRNFTLMLPLKLSNLQSFSFHTHTQKVVGDVRKKKVFLRKQFHQDFIFNQQFHQFDQFPQTFSSGLYISTDTNIIFWSEFYSLPSQK